MCCSHTFLSAASYYLADLVVAQNPVDTTVVVAVAVAAQGSASTDGLAACVDVAVALHAHGFDIVGDVVVVVAHDFVVGVAAAHEHTVVGDVVVAYGLGDGVVAGGDDVVVAGASHGLADDHRCKHPFAWRQHLQ